jgi:hypothetical protein
VKATLAALAILVLAGGARPSPVEPARAAQAVRPEPMALRVGMLSGGHYTVTTILLETYVARVVAGEAARESRPAALAALAIAVRTFALANRSRHRADGFDLCDQTHCQVVRTATAATTQAADATAGRLLLRGGVPASIVARLARADAFGSLQLNRRASLWQALIPITPKGTLPLFDELHDTESPLELPTMDARAEVFADYRTTGLSLKSHPISFFRSQLEQLGIVPSAKLAELKDGRFVRVGGLVLVRQRPGTAKGITFVTLEDETGVANLIIRMDVWEKFYTVARTAPAFIAST